jgi:hypothetical protein
MKTPTVTSVRAKVKRAAAAEGFYLKLVHSKATEYREAYLHVSAGFSCNARDAGLDTWRDLNRKQTLTDWLRSVLTVEELRTVSVQVEVDNSEIQIDYFSKDYERVLPDWGSYVNLGTISISWAEDLIGAEDNYGSYDRGTRGFTKSEVASLAPSDAHAWALAFFVTHKADTRTETMIDKFVNLNEAARNLFEAMLQDWKEGTANLLDAVEALVPQEAPAAPVLVAAKPVERLTEQPEPATEIPQAFSDYLGRLIHVPKKLYASRVYAALTAGEELPESEAAWADDVLKRVRRYAKV